MPNFDAAYWDDRYRAADSVWGAAPNLWVEQEVRDLPPGVAADLACGEGRNAAWLGQRGWRVFAVDFSKVGLEKGAAGRGRHRGRAARHLGAGRRRRVPQPGAARPRDADLPAGGGAGAARGGAQRRGRARARRHAAGGRARLPQPRRRDRRAAEPRTSSTPPSTSPTTSPRSAWRSSGPRRCSARSTAPSGPPSTPCSGPAGRSDAFERGRGGPGGAQSEAIAFCQAAGSRASPGPFISAKRTDAAPCRRGRCRGWRCPPPRGTRRTAAPRRRAARSPTAAGSSAAPARRRSCASTGSRR